MKFQKKDLFTIPNILTYVRLICVPIFVWFILDKSIPNNVWWGLGIFLFASATDVVDGIIARKCNMISDIGKVLDPLADKLLQVAALITLTLIGYIHPAFPIIIVAKEAYMIIGAAVLLFFARRKVTIQSNVWGKLATVFLAMSVFSSFFHEVLVDNKVYLDVFLFSITSLLTVIAAIQYTVIMIKEIRSGDSDTKTIDKRADEIEHEEVEEEMSEETLGGSVVIDVDESEIEVESKED